MVGGRIVMEPGQARRYCAIPMFITGVTSAASPWRWVSPSRSSTSMSSLPPPCRGIRRHRPARTFQGCRCANNGRPTILASKRKSPAARTGKFRQRCRERFGLVRDPGRCRTSECTAWRILKQTLSHAARATVRLHRTGAAEAGWVVGHPSMPRRQPHHQCPIGWTWRAMSS